MYQYKSRPSPYHLLHSSIFSHIDDKSELRVATPNFLPRVLDTWLTPSPGTHNAMTGMITCTFHRLFRSEFTMCIFISKSHQFDNLSSATQRLFETLIPMFPRFTTNEIVGISKDWYSHQLNPNLDSAKAINKCFYYSHESLPTITCYNIST
jgi:hypothetical protein